MCVGVCVVCMPTVHMCMCMVVHANMCVWHVCACLCACVHVHVSLFVFVIVSICNGASMRNFAIAKTKQRTAKTKLDSKNKIGQLLNATHLQDAPSINRF